MNAIPTVFAADTSPGPTCFAEAPKIPQFREFSGNKAALAVAHLAQGNEMTNDRVNLPAKKGIPVAAVSLCQGQRQPILIVTACPMPNSLDHEKGRTQSGKR